VNKLKTGTVVSTTAKSDNRDDHIAIRLLRVQARLEALDRLYNEEISSISRELAQLKSEYVRLCQSGSSVPHRGKSSRRPASRSYQTSDESR
jgi:hypothetical protein